MTEKRHFPRAELSTIVDYSSNINARARDVSESGIGILSRSNFKSGTPLFLTISLPETGTIKVIGKIVWTSEIKSDLYMNGLKFFSIRDNDRSYFMFAKLNNSFLAFRFNARQT